MLSPEPPSVVVEQPASCSEGDAARGMFERALGAASAPGPGWVVRVRVAQARGAATATGELADGAAGIVARRSFTSAGKSCAPLARAIGVWVALVLDQQPTRAPVQAEAQESEAPQPAKPIATDTTYWPTPAAQLVPSPEAELFLHHPDLAHSAEVGAGGLLMGGSGASTLVGGSVFGVFEMRGGVFLRPAIGYGQTIDSLQPASDLKATYWGSRIDGCGRIPGYYHDSRGMQLDLCGGVDVGFIQVEPIGATATERAGAAERTLPLLALGPAVGLRGELGSSLAVEMRGVGLLNVVRAELGDGTRVDRRPSLLAGRVELALTWRLR